MSDKYLSLVEETVSINAINKIGTKKFVRLFIYGALMTKEVFCERLAGEFEDEGIDIDAEYDSLFCGLYKMPNRKFVFNKERSGVGVGSLIVGDSAEYVVGAVMLVPKSALRPGSDLMISEGAVSYDVFDAGTHYTLSTNASMNLEPISNGGFDLMPILAHQSVFYFIAGTKHTSMELTPNRSYQASIVASLQGLQSKGWQISSHYINYIKSL